MNFESQKAFLEIDGIDRLKNKSSLLTESYSLLYILELLTKASTISR